MTFDRCGRLGDEPEQQEARDGDTPFKRHGWYPEMTPAWTRSAPRRQATCAGPRCTRPTSRSPDANDRPTHHRLAVLPAVTHYDINLVPGLSAAAVPYLEDPFTRRRAP